MTLKELNNILPTTKKVDMVKKEITGKKEVVRKEEVKNNSSYKTKLGEKALYHYIASRRR